MTVIIGGITMNRTYFKYFVLFFALMSPAVHAENFKQLPAVPGADLQYPTQIDMEHRDPLTTSTIAELMDEQAEEELPLVIAMATTLVPTSSGEANVRPHFYEGHALSKYLFGRTYYVTVDKQDVSEPETRLGLSGDIHYFILENGSKAFSYLGCGSDLCSPSAPNYKNIVNHLVATQSENLGNRAIAQLALAVFYKQEGDMLDAKRWYALAAVQTDDLEVQSQAANNLAIMSDQGFQFSNGVAFYQAGDIPKAKAWFLLAAQQAENPALKAQAQFNLGIIAKNRTEAESAIHWFTLAASQQDDLDIKANSQLLLGVLYRELQNIPKAKEWLLLAQAQSEGRPAKAKAILGGICYEQGEI